MVRPRIAVLVAARDDSDTRRNFRRELDATLVEFDATAGDLPPTFDFDGVIVTGSRSSVYWEEDWIDLTGDWVREAADRGLPCLGVCWGHQLLADVLGGRVAPMDEYEIGYRTVEHSGDSRLFDGVPGEFTAFTTHSDEVVELPPGAEVLAENDYSIHAFRKGRVYGVQFHPEYDAHTAREVARGKEGQITDERLQRVLEGIDEESYRAACEAKRVFDNFLSVVEDARAERTPAASAD